MWLGSHSPEYAAEIPEGYEAEESNVQLRKWGEIDEEDKVENWLTALHSHSNEADYVADAP